MDCTIHIGANPDPKTHRYGGLAKPFSGRVRDALRHRTVYYSAVFNHVSGCNKCDPNEVLRAYLTGRNTPKHKGLMSREMMKLMTRYCANFDIDQSVQETFNLRSVDSWAFISLVKDKNIQWAIDWMRLALVRWEECGGWGELNALDDVFQKTHRFDQKDLKQEAVTFLLNYHRKNDRLPSDDELENLMAMVDVMGT